MHSPTLGLRVASTIFALVCVAHLLRIITHTDVIIAGRELPMWINIIGVMLAGALSLWMWGLSKAVAR